MATLPMQPVTAKNASGGGGAVGQPIPAPPPVPAGQVPATGASNPTVPFGGAPQVPVGTAVSPILGQGVGTPGSGISTGLSTNYGDYTLAGDFAQTYGKGTGTALEGVLANLGTSTDNAVAATTNATLNAAQKQAANIASGEAAAGVSADSSTAALAQGDFASTVNQQISSQAAQMELGEENTLISALQQEGGAHGSDTSGWDTFANVLTGTQSIAGLASGASAATSAINPGADTGILDALALL